MTKVPVAGMHLIPGLLPLCCKTIKSWTRPRLAPAVDRERRSQLPTFLQAASLHQHLPVWSFQTHVLFFSKDSLPILENTLCHGFNGGWGKDWLPPSSKIARQSPLRAPQSGRTQRVRMGGRGRFQSRSGRQEHLKIFWVRHMVPEITMLSSHFFHNDTEWSYCRETGGGYIWPRIGSSKVPVKMK